MEHKREKLNSEVGVLGGPPPYESIVQEPPVDMTIIQQPTSTVIPVIIGKEMGRHPEIALCPNCNIQIQTRVVPKPTTKTHIIAAIFCVLGLWPCACMSYCCTCCTSVDHFCPNPHCNSYIGTYVF